MSEFKKSLRAKDLMALSLGAMIGWSWVILTGSMILKAGSLGTLLAFLLGGTIIVFIGFLYAELAPALPFAGGEHIYTLRALGRQASFVCSWMVVLAYSSVVAFEAAALPTALEYLFPQLFTDPALWQVAGYPVKASHIIVGCGGAVIMTGINLLGIKVASSFQRFVTFFIIIAGFCFLFGSGVNGAWTNASPYIQNGLEGILSVMMMVPFFMVGFDVIPQAAEEVNLPPRRMGIILLVSLVSALLWYMLIAFGVSLAMPREAILAASVPVPDAAARVGGEWMGKLIMSAGVAGIITSWNSFLIGGSRAMYAMSHTAMLPRIFSRLSTKYNSPNWAILLIGVLSLAAPLFGKQAFSWIVNAGSFGLSIVYVLVAISFVVLRKKEPELPRPYKLRFPNFLGIGGIILALFLMSLYLPIGPSQLVPIEWAIVGVWITLGYGLWGITQQDKEIQP